MFQILSVFIKPIHELQCMGPHMLTQGSCAWEGLVNQLPKSPMTHSLRVKQWYTSCNSLTQTMALFFLSKEAFNYRNYHFKYF